MMDESFRKFLSSFEDLKKARGKLEKTTKEGALYPSPSEDASALYKDQLQDALAKQNFSMDDYLNVSSIT